MKTSNSYGSRAGRFFVGKAITANFISARDEMVRLYPTSEGPGFYCMVKEKVGHRPEVSLISVEDIILKDIMPEEGLTKFVDEHMAIDVQNSQRTNSGGVFTTMVKS